MRLFGWCLLSLLSMPAMAQEPDSTALLQSQFLEAMKEVERTCNSLKFFVICKSIKEETDAKSKVRVRTSRFQLAIDGKRYLSKISVEGKPGNTVRATNDKYLFQINTRDDSKPYALHLVEQHGSDARLDEIASKTREDYIMLPLATTYFLNRPIYQIAKSNTFKIVNASRDALDGNLVRITFEDRTADVDRIKAGECIVDGFLVCDTNKNWAMREYGGTLQNTDGQKVKVHSKIDFGNVVDGFQLPKEVSLRIDRPNGLNEKDIFSVEPAERELSPDMFLLSYYGLPEPVFKSNGTWRFIMLGLFFVASGSLLVIYGRKRWRSNVGT
jgi:hypothetical protein